MKAAWAFFIRRGPAILVACLCIVTLASAASYFQQARRFVPIVTLAAASIRTPGINAGALQKALPTVQAIMSEGVCRSDILSAGTRLVMLDIERRMMGGGERAAYREALAFAERYFRHALGCNPQNGDFWLRLAMIRGLRQPFPEEIAALMTMSQKLAPANGNVLEGRYAVWSTLPASALDLARPAYEADFAVICSEKGGALRARLREACKGFAASPKAADGAGSS